MSYVINLTCPSCGGKLQITNDIERFACGNCGNELIVQRSGGAISLAPVVQEIRGVKTGVDKTASELAIVRLNEEISALYKQMVTDFGDEHDWVYIIFAIVMILMGIVALFSNGGLTCGGPIILIGILGGVKAYIYEVDHKEKVETSLINNAEIEKIIYQKEQELRKHQAIVSVR